MSIKIEQSLETGVSSFNNIDSKSDYSHFIHPAEFFRHYDAELVESYERGLCGVLRFQNPEMPPIDLTFQENDLTHTYSCIERFHAFLDACPKNRNYLESDINDIAQMLYLHEAGETLAGDTPITLNDFAENPSLSTLHVKRILRRNGNRYHSQDEIRELIAHAEHDYFRYFGLPLVATEFRDEIKRIYFRFETPHPTDHSAKLAKSFDIIDGNHTGLIAFQNQNPHMGATSRILYNEGTEKVGMKLAQTVSTYASLIPEKEAIEALDYFIEQCEIFRIYGYPKAWEKISTNMKETAIFIQKSR